MPAIGLLSLWISCASPSEPLVPSEPAPTVEPTTPAPSEPSVPEGPTVPTSPTPPTLPPTPGVDEPDDPTAVPERPAAIAGDGPLAIELEWNAPTSCPQGDRVRTVVATLLDREVELEPTADVTVRGDVAPIGSRWLLQLSVDIGGAIEQRRLEADRCETLADAAALVVATGIDPRRVAATLAEPPKTPTGDRTPRAATGTPKKEPKVRVALGVASGPALGIVPKVAAWLQGDVMLLIGRGRVGAQVGHAFDRKTGDGVGAVVRNTTGTLRGCFAPTQRKISLPVCGLFEMGAVSARGRGPGIDSQPQRELWIALGLGAGIEYAPIRRLALFANVDALVALRRPRFHVNTASGPEEVYRVSPAGVRLVLGVSVRLP